MKLVVEELFTNMVRHNAGSPYDITVEITVEVAVDGDNVIVVLTDRDSDYFDPREHTEVDIRARIKDRTPGGLGIHLVRHMVDELDYHYVDRTSVITLKKRIEKPDAHVSTQP